VQRLVVFGSGSLGDYLGQPAAATAGANSSSSSSSSRAVIPGVSDAWSAVNDQACIYNQHLVYCSALLL
jgi:hypothetical protein